MNRLAIAALSSLSLALAGAPAHAQAVTALQAKAKAAMPAARRALDDQLFDYTSARFRDVRAGYTEIGSAPYLCGMVNAKNRSGAYVGWRSFYWSSWSTDALHVEGADGEDAAYVAQHCDSSDSRDRTDYSAALTYGSR